MLIKSKRWNIYGELEETRRIGKNYTDEQLDLIAHRLRNDWRVQSFVRPGRCDYAREGFVGKYKVQVIPYNQGGLVIIRGERKC